MTDLAARPANPNAYRRGVVLIVLGAITASWMGLGVRLMDEATAWQILTIRSFGATVFVTAIILVSYPGHLVGTFRRAAKATVIGGIGIAVAFSGVIVALQLTTVANTMFVMAAAPFLAAVLGRIVLGEHVRPATWLAIFVALFGVALMVVDNVRFGYLWGNVAALIAAIGLAVFVVALRSDRDVIMLPAAAFGGLLGTVVALVMCLAVTGEGLAMSTHDILLSLALGVFQLGLAMWFITAGARYVPAAEIALLNLTEVVLGPLWVWLFLDEATGTMTLLGGVLVLAAVIGDAVSGERERRRRLRQQAAV
jgi:drug/metabolite transporter (DMT)-like permease